jgi:AraC-like DNA-binding protein
LLRVPNGCSTVCRRTPHGLGHAVEPGLHGIKDAGAYAFGWCYPFSDLRTAQAKVGTGRRPGIPEGYVGTLATGPISGLRLIGISPKRASLLPKVNSRRHRTLYCHISPVRRSVASRKSVKIRIMPGGVAATFSESEDFETALRSEGCLSLVITGRGQFRAHLTKIILQSFRLSAGDEQLSRIAFIAVPDDMVLISFPIGKGTLPVYGGIRMRVGDIMTLSPGEQVHARTDGQRRWGAIWVPVAQLVDYGRALTGAPFSIPPVAQRWRPGTAAGRELRSLHTAATRIAVTRPQLFANVHATHGLEQQLIYAIVNCLSAGSADAGGAAARRRQDVMAQFERLLHTQPDRAIRVEEICATLGVSPGLLRRLCAEHLGMSPITYDRRRRMSLARRALRHKGAKTATVAETARRYGFRQPGRFAIIYRAAFGESPSATLRQARDRSIV